MKRIAWVAGVVVAWSLVATAARSQTADAALKDRVSQLLERLDATKTETRQSAEDALIKLGPRVLPLLPETEKGLSDDRKQRLRRIRDTLREATDKLNLDASKVTLQAKGMRLRRSFRSSRRKPATRFPTSGNQGASWQPRLEGYRRQNCFLEALDIVCKQAEITPNYFTGDGSIGLLNGKPLKSAGGLSRSVPGRVWAVSSAHPRPPCRYQRYELPSLTWRGS